MDIRSWKIKSQKLKTEVYTLYLASRHPRTPWYAKVLAALIIGYALSPIDLIPDFIPVVGYLDDLILVPLGIALLIKIIPGDILEECRAKAEANLSKKKPKSWVAAIIIVLIWLLVIYVALTLIWPLVFEPHQARDSNAAQLFWSFPWKRESRIRWNFNKTLDTRFREYDGAWQAGYPSPRRGEGGVKGYPPLERSLTVSISLRGCNVCTETL